MGSLIGIVLVNCLQVKLMCFHVWRPVHPPNPHLLLFYSYAIFSRIVAFEGICNFNGSRHLGWPIFCEIYSTCSKWSLLHISANLVSNWITFFSSWIFIRGQFWPPGIVVACVCVCVCINHLLISMITRHLFKLGSPNLVHRSKTPWLRSLLFWGAIDLDLQGQI